MSATPRLRSGFPATPATAAQRQNPHETPSTVGTLTSNASLTKSPALPLAPENTSATRIRSQPVIPLTFLDAPQQRLYAFAVYVLLWAWKLYDWLQVVEDGDSSWWLFLKWILIDFAFLFGLPELRVPWLELSQFIVTTLFTGHVLLNYMLMFNIPLPWQAWLLGFAKVLYDREISISEHNVKVSSILNNHSLIMGKQIINILPEGTAVLNPKAIPYCLGSTSKTGVSLPIYFNATVPAEIELIRTDLDTNKQEIIRIPGRDVQKVARAIRDQSADPNTVGFNWQYVVKKPGVYRLGRVLDEYKLEVQRATKETYVVICPRAKIKATESSERCIRDLSDLSLEVVGTPPLKIMYSRAVNGKNHDFRFQSLQPDGFASPLIAGPVSGTVSEGNDISWVRPATVTVGLNESLTSSGEWEYSVDEVHDAFGNIVKYARPGDDVDATKPKGLTQRFAVRERPKVRMGDCDLRNPIKVARGHTKVLPVKFGVSGSIQHTAHEISWEFSPIDTLTNSGDHGGKSSIQKYSAKNSKDIPRVSEPGLYTLRSVKSGSCEGEVAEPSSCLLLNPLEPQLSIRSEDIPDKCAGNSIGLRVNLDLVGNPPFDVLYDIISDGEVEHRNLHVTGLRSQLELMPKKAGLHKYVFKSISDNVYMGLPLSGRDMVVEQEVKPAASAKFAHPRDVINACLDSQVEVNVALNGEPPFNLEWETVHEGRRKAERAESLSGNSFTIKTAALTKGGEYILALSSVQDKRGCRTYLQDQIKIAVRRQRPRAAFGSVEQKNSVLAVEATSLHLPLRLQGEAPWTVRYRNLNDSAGGLLSKTATAPNDHVVVQSRGVYEIVEVQDSQCPGVVDTGASTFSVDWFPRPEISLVQTVSVKGHKDGFTKQDVCEGDIDGFEVNLRGSPPYHVSYEIRHKLGQGSNAMTRRDFDAALSKASISMDTSKAGDYTYKFVEVADNLYNSDTTFQPLVVQQRVNARPTAAFSKPGQSFKYCAEEQDHEDKIPITLTGVAPFYVEVEIKHQSGSAPETYRIPSIDSNTYSMPVPREHLRLGTQQLRIRRVRDAKGCQQKYEVNAPSIQIQLFDAPSIYPLESREDFCVGERIAYTLSGTPPFEISYEFNGRWNAKSQSTNFRRVAEKPGDFTITGVSDKASECRAAVNLRKQIHPLPSVQISRGKQSRVDIHEGNEVDILFEFWGTPPFEFTYTRSSNAKKGHKSVVLETRHDVSHEHSKVIKANQEGTYEVVAIKDKYCSFSTQQVAEKKEVR